jgi:hypothetical protein
MSDLIALAERCERVTGDSFDLNHDIAAALGVASEPFTASIDAAMTLVPEGWRVRDLNQWVDQNKASTNIAWTVRLRLNGRSMVEVDAEADTAALALCAAALRARSSQREAE